MAKALTAGLLAVLVGACTGGPARPGPAESALANPFDKRILVMIADPDIDRFDLRGARSGPYRFARVYSGPSAGVSRILADLGRDYQLEPVEGWAMRSLGVYCEVFQLAAEASVDELIGTLSADARIESVQPMQFFELQARGEPDFEPWDDPYRPLQHALEDLGVTEAHRWASGRGVRVAVIDTGVDAAHPELDGQIVELQDFVGGRAAMHGDRHGTAVAGVIGSLGGNHRGIVGVAPGARLLALKACEQQRDGRGVCTSFSLARAIDRAIVADSDVLNLSLAGPADRLLERLLDVAIKRGIVVVAALADGQEEASFPASMAGVIAVCGDDAPPDRRDLRAPGLDVLTLVPPDGYDFLSGSSLAAAHVSGVVALLLERAPTLSPAEIRGVLARTAHPLEGQGRTAGLMVSACAALAEVTGEMTCRVGLAHAGDGYSPLESD